MKRSLALAAALMLSTCMASPVIACTAYVGGFTGVLAADTRADLAGLKDGSASTGGLASARVGFDCSAQKLVYGLWADADIYRAVGGSPVVLGTEGAKLDHAAAVGAKFGWRLNPFVTPYIVAGWGWVWTDDITAGATTVKMPSLSGPLAGLGFDNKLTNKLSLDVQYRAQLLDEKALAGTGGAVRFEGTDHTVRIGFTYHFNGEAAAAAPPLK